MKTKTIVYLVLAGLLAVLVLKNRQDVPFWFFGDRSIPILLLLAAALILGFGLGMAIFRSRKTHPRETMEEEDEYDEYAAEADDDGLDEADRDYIS